MNSMSMVEQGQASTGLSRKRCSRPGFNRTLQKEVLKTRLQQDSPERGAQGQASAGIAGMRCSWPDFSRNRRNEAPACFGSPSGLMTCVVQGIAKVSMMWARTIFMNPQYGGMGRRCTYIKVPWWFAVAFWLLICCACIQESPDVVHSDAHFEKKSQAIRNGTRDPQLVALNPGQILAIGWLPTKYTGYLNY